MNLPVLIYSTFGLPEARAFAEWQAVIAPMFHVEPAPLHRVLPRGSTKSILVGEVIANRTVFTAQHLTRDAALVAATPGHLLLQAYISGGFHGELGGQPTTIGKGMVAVTDLRRTVDVRTATSNTVGLTLPQGLAAKIGADALTPRLDPGRNRLLAAWVVAFYRRLPQSQEADVPRLLDELTTFLRRLSDGSHTAGISSGPETNSDMLALAEQLIRANLNASDISPLWLAERLGISRATLYRLLAPLGGVMRLVQEQRLLMAHEALSDALETRGLAQIASDAGMRSATLFSRNFRERFGVTPSAYREAVLQATAAARPASPEPVRGWWNRIGH